MGFQIKNIVAELARKNITRQSLAKKIKISSNSLSKKLNGIVDFKVSELEKIAKVLDVPITIFFE
jgi:transcriptional regulator with XRE-family HTH domain